MPESLGQVWLRGLGGQIIAFYAVGDEARVDVDGECIWQGDPQEVIDVCRAERRRRGLADE